MSVPAPHFLLFSESSRYATRGEQARPQWRFVLESVDGSSKLEAADEEPQVQGDRLDLLAVVRGLEALDQPSRVTLVTPSRYVCRGLRFGLDEWRETDWQWERFGQMTPVKNRDLWRRVDRALKFHEVEVRNWRYEEAEESAGSMQEQTQPSVKVTVSGVARSVCRLVARCMNFARRMRIRWSEAIARRAPSENRSALA
jgi:ribonuclease HI